MSRVPTRVARSVGLSPDTYLQLGARVKFRDNGKNEIIARDNLKERDYVREVKFITLWLSLILRIL